MAAAPAPAPVPVPAPVMDAVAGTLREAVDRRSPTVTAALDTERAWAVARAWAQDAVPDATVEAVHIGSVLYRPDGSCTLRYSVRLAPSGREQLLLVEMPRSATDVLVRPFPADPDLPTLSRALDPVLMREVLGRVVPGTGGDRGVGRCTVDVIHYPRRGRCVLRYRLSLGAGGEGELRHPVVFGKVYGDDTAPAAASGLRLLRNGLRRLPKPLRIDVPRPLAVVPSLRLLLVEPIAGRPSLPGLLKDSCDPAGQPPGSALPDAVRSAARTASAVHLCAAPPTGLPVRDLDGERTVTEQELSLLEPVWPDTAARLRRGLSRALEALPEHRRPTGWPVTPVLAHGDFTPSQVLLDDSGRAGLVDVDTLCLAEPAVDLGRFLAYQHVIGIRRSRDAWPLLEDLTALFVESYLDAWPPPGGAPATDVQEVLLARTAAHHALALARIGASACWQLKDDRLGAAIDVLEARDAGLTSVLR